MSLMENRWKKTCPKILFGLFTWVSNDNTQIYDEAITKVLDLLLIH